MVTITTNRGTSTIKTQDVMNWAGQTFKNFEKARLAQIKNETLTTKRGTDVVKVKDIPTITKIDLKGQTITVKRGTGVITL
jgi:hypothetical protein